MFFYTDDKYINEINTIIKYSGHFTIFRNFSYRPTTIAQLNSRNYVWTNQKALLSVNDTLLQGSSKFELQVHGNLCQALEMTKNLEGDIVEIGVYLGGSAQTILNYLKNISLKRNVYLLDLFEGFTDEGSKQSSDTFWYGTHGEGKNGIEKVQKRLKVVDYPFTPIKCDIYKEELPKEINNIVLANIDVDIYDATLAGLQKIDQKLVSGGIIICEDPAATPGTIGSYVAMTNFLESEQGKNYTKIYLESQYFLLKK